MEIMSEILLMLMTVKSIFIIKSNPKSIKI